MARGIVYLRFPGGSRSWARTDLTGHGPVPVGAEFVARQTYPWGRATQLVPDGFRKRVRVTGVGKEGGLTVLQVEVLEDLARAKRNQGELF